MRIILLLAAAAGSAWIAAAAAAPPARSGGHGAWAPNDGHRAGHGRPRDGWGPIRPRDHRRRGRSGHERRDSLFVDGGGYGYGPSGLISPWGNGYFAGGGGEVRMKDGRPVYGYDRSYPYEWAPAARGRPDREEEQGAGEPPPRCTVENGVRVCRGW